MFLGLPLHKFHFLVREYKHIFISFIYLSNFHYDQRIKTTLVFKFRDEYCMIPSNIQYKHIETSRNIILKTKFSFVRAKYPNILITSAFTVIF